MKYFSSDLHLHHHNVLKYSNRPFENVVDMERVIIANLFDVMKMGDDLYLLGDLSMDKNVSRNFIKMVLEKVNLHFIMGNHDCLSKSFLLELGCSSVSDIKEIHIGDNNVTLCHYPMAVFNKSHFNAWHLYGHQHNGTAGDPLKGKRLNVNVEFHEYKPWSETEVIEYMKTQPDNWDLIER